MIKLDSSENTRWGMALDQLGLPMPQAPQAPKAPEALRPKAPKEPKPKTAAQIKAAARRDRWRMVARVCKAIGNFLHNRARDLGLAVIVIGTFVAVFQGSLTSATLFSFRGYAGVAFALMPDALMIISAAKMRGLRVSPVQRREAKISMYFSLAFSLLSNMIAATYLTMPELFTPVVRAGGAIAYHGVIVVFLWRAVETSTKTREDAPSVRSNAKGRKASTVKAPGQRVAK